MSAQASIDTALATLRARSVVTHLGSVAHECATKPRHQCWPCSLEDARLRRRFEAIGRFVTRHKDRIDPDVVAKVEGRLRNWESRAYYVRQAEEAMRASCDQECTCGESPCAMYADVKVARTKLRQQSWWLGRETLRALGREDEGSGAYLTAVSR